MAGAVAVDVDRLSHALDEVGFRVERSVVPAALVEALRTEVVDALALERDLFPPGDEQYGRLLFAARHGGAFLDLLAFDPLFDPIEGLIGRDAIVYTYTSSCLPSGCSGPVSELHDDFDPRRSTRRLALAALVMLDEFAEETGATEMVVGTHLSEDAERTSDGPRAFVTGGPGDVCYFDPRILHRSTLNRGDDWRRSVIVMMVEPWIRQRFDVARMLGPTTLDDQSPEVARRLGFGALAPGSPEEFVARRTLDRRYG